MPMFNDFDNDQWMRRSIVCPAEATDEELASFIEPYVPVEVRRYERSCILFWYSGDLDLGEVRRRIDAWEVEHDRRRRERWKLEHDAKWAEKLETMDLTEPGPDAFWRDRENE